MRQQDATLLIDRIRTRFLFARLLEVVLFAIGFGLVVYGFSVFTGFSETVRLMVSLLACVSFAVTWIWINGSLNIDKEAIAQFISVQQPQLEYSTDLLLMEDEKLNRLERLQKEKAKTNFALIANAVKVPYTITKPLMVVLMGLFSVFLLSGLKGTADVSTKRTAPVSTVAAAIPLPPELKDFSITVTSPTYMGLKPLSQEQAELHIQEGSRVQWKFAFSETVKQAYLIFSGSDSVAVKENSGLYAFSRTFIESSFYQIGWVDTSDKIFTSDYYRIEVRPDNPPDIEITNPPQFLDLEIKDDQRVTITSELKDDWGMNGAHIIATISKGSGESVKFREEKLLFTSPSVITGKNVKASLQIDLRKMGMEPGDELYFYVVGNDNKQPISNRTRTETHFIALADTATIDWAMDDGLGVDLMPEYFRSQRQIIIDTEKLLREKKAIEKQEFNARSNELGYDQKLLRLKYGEFLGEEFESGITQAESHAEGAEHDEEDPLAAYSHKHDVEGEHQEVVLVEKKEGEKEDPLSAFTHKHDDSETATFFEQSIRAKLKAALAVMWDAELYLRLYEPDKSLPFQYKALKLLKEISNDSRIYVHKVGFDPPPVKEDKRLTGELKDVYSNTAKWNTTTQVKFPNTRIALQEIEKLLLQSAVKIPEKVQIVFQNTGAEIATAILKNPSIPLETLTLLKRVTDGALSQDEFLNDLKILRGNLMRIVPNDPEVIGKSTSVLHPLENQFTEAVDKNK